MSAVRPHPSRPGEPTAPTARVRHRETHREGRVAGEAAEPGNTRVLFDGDTHPVSVPGRKLAYLDDPQPEPGARP